MTDHHTHAAFDNDIERLRACVTTMGGLVERQLQGALTAVRACDEGIVERVLADEVEVNRLHVETDRRCNLAIAMRQPAAADLREIVSVIHINGDLERVGDEAKKIALRSRDVCGMPLPPVPVARLDRAAALAAAMLRSAVDAYVRQDAQVLATLHDQDADLDAQRDALVDELLGSMSSQPHSASSALAMIFIVQSLERIGDHAKSIAEYVVQIVDGVDVRHTR